MEYSEEINIWDAGDMERGYGKAIKINKDWLASCTSEVYRDSSLIIVFETYHISKRYPRSITAMTDMPVSTGCYDLFPRMMNDQQFPVLLHWTQTLDIGEDDYQLFSEDGLPNRIEIKEISADSIIGEFSFSVVKDTLKSRNNPDNPIFIRFLNGEFRVALN